MGDSISSDIFSNNVNISTVADVVSSGMLPSGITGVNVTGLPGRLLFLFDDQ